MSVLKKPHSTRQGPDLPTEAQGLAGRWTPSHRADPVHTVRGRPHLPGLSTATASSSTGSPRPEPPRHPSRPAGTASLAELPQLLPPPQHGDGAQVQGDFTKGLPRESPGPRRGGWVRVRALRSLWHEPPLTSRPGPASSSGHLRSPPPAEIR